jgi:uncharacterized protein YunC (DUF1805 family)
MTTEKFLEVTPVILDKGTALGVSVATPEAPILLIKATHGFIMCGVLDVAGLDELLPGKIAAAKISGVRSVEDLLNKNVRGMTVRARALGVTEGMTGKEALEKMM